MKLSRDLFKLNDFIVFFLVFIVFVVLYIVVIYFEEFFTNNVFVDGVNWYFIVKDLSFGLISYEEIRSSWLLFFIYELLYDELLVLTFLFNSLFVVFSFRILRIHLVVAFLFLPFFIINLPLPSKDILVLLFFCSYIFFLSKREHFKCVLVSLAVLFVRDAAGVFLFMFVFVSYFNVSLRFLVIFLFFLAALFSQYIHEIHEITGWFFLERTLYFFVANEDMHINGYFIRVIGNISNFISRMVFFSESNRFSLTGLSLYFSGLGIFTSFLASLNVLFLKKNTNTLFLNEVAGLFLLVVFAFSISPIIQPRYLIPFSMVFLSFYIYSFGFRYSLKFFFLSVFFGLFLRLVYLYIDIDLPVLSDFWFFL
ncbi:hypothetical protein [Marinospirillum minutulum]|uniref:hypothetical protein n=1 Tax=Marinospirillum minutulum TaxID=64974 RepID=UPI0004154274|nr:hypothetical protein [Marinospirillum minutulum]